MPAMILSSVDLPEPLRPSTPILAPGKKDREMSLRISLRRHDLADAVHGENVLSHSTGNPWERRRMQRKSVDYPRMRQYGLLQDPVACNVSMLLGTKKAPFWLPTLYFICL
jgi:hypothetical protein